MMEGLGYTSERLPGSSNLIYRTRRADAVEIEHR
jgi:hypothetical protein